MSGSTAASSMRTDRTCRSSTVASSSATGSSRRSACGAATRPSWPSTRRAFAGPPPASISRSPGTSPRDWRPGSPTCSPRTGSTDRPVTPPVRITVSRGPFRGQGPPAARRGRRADHRDPGLAGRRAPGRSPRARAAPRRVHRPARSGQPAGGPQDHVAGRVRLRPARGSPCRRRRRALPDHRRPPLRGDLGQPLPRPPRAGRWGRRARDAGPRVRDPARDDPLLAARLGGSRRAPSGRGTAAPR